MRSFKLQSAVCHVGVSVCAEVGFWPRCVLFSRLHCHCKQFDRSTGVFDGSCVTVIVSFWIFIPALQSAARNVNYDVRSFALQSEVSSLLGSQFFIAIHRRFLDRVSACKIRLRPRIEAASQAYTGELKPLLDAAIPAKVDHVLAIIFLFPACMGFRHHWLRSVNSIQFHARRTESHLLMSKYNAIQCVDIVAFFSTSAAVCALG